MKRIARIALLSLSFVALGAAQGATQASSLLGIISTLTGSSDTAATDAPAPPAAPASPMQLAAATTKRVLKDGTFTGQPFDAYYGMVQVEATVQNGQIAGVNTLQSPDHRSTSRAINRKALPILENEVITAQTVRVNLVSGATLTSKAYIRSLNSALRQALH